MMVSFKKDFKFSNMILRVQLLFTKLLFASAMFCNLLNLKLTICEVNWNTIHLKIHLDYPL